jgi:hypothetical protein
MGRKAIEIDREYLNEQLREAEASKTFDNQNQLFTFLADQFGCKPIIIRNRVLAWGLTVNTPKGKRGRSLGEGKGVATGPRKRKGKPEDYKVALRMAFSDDNLNKRVEAACKGSLKSAVALKCYECSGYSKKDVSLCTITKCALWAYRPWVNQLSLTAEGRKIIQIDSNKAIKEEE